MKPTRADLAPDIPPHIDVADFLAKMEAARAVSVFDKGTWYWEMHPRQARCYEGIRLLLNAPRGRRGRVQRSTGHRLVASSLSPKGFTRKMRKKATRWRRTTPGTCERPMPYIHGWSTVPLG